MKHFSRPFYRVLGLLSLSFIAGALGGASILWYSNIPNAPLSTHETTEVNEASNFLPTGSYQAVYEKAAPAVVSIVALKEIKEVNSTFPFQFGPFGFFQSPQNPSENPENSEGKTELKKVSSGTGFIFTPDGFVITNKHVVADPTAEYAVILNDGTQLTAKILDQDALNDIAFLQITQEDERLGSLPHLSFGNSETLAVGESVLAIGNALGEYSNTLTVGVLSAIDRQIVASGAGFGSENLVNLLQTDAAINPGNSGGPLLNLAGEVIGMNTAIDSTAQGIGFAIPSNDIASLVKSYQENGHIVRAYLGVSSVLVSPRLKDHFKLNVDQGAYIIGDIETGPGVIKGSPADKAGLREGDIILSVDDKEINDRFTLQNAIASYQVGEEVSLKIARGEETLTLKVRLEERED